MRIEKTFHRSISPKRIFKGVVISLLFIFVFSFIFDYYYKLISNYYSEETPDSPTFSEIHTYESEKEKDVKGTSFEDEEVIAGYKEEILQYIDEMQFSMLIFDGLFKLRDEDILKTREYTESINRLATDCFFSAYSFNKEDIPSSELLDKIEKIEKLSASFCKDLKDSSELTFIMLSTDDFDSAARDLEKVRDLNGVAYNKSLLIDQFCAELDASINN